MSRRRDQLAVRIGLLPIVACALAVFALPASGARDANRLAQAAAAAAASGLVCTAGPTFNLTAKKGYVSTPDGNSVFMWGFAKSGGSFQMPGPVLCVTQGQTVTVNLTNQLPEPVSIVFPGQTGVTTTGGAAGLFTREAAPNGSVTYRFVASQPGTYLYETGTNVKKQVDMGLYGALIVRPSMGAKFAYSNTATQFNPAQEYLLLLHEFDPLLHRAVELGQPYDPTKFHPRYWAINGRSFPDTIADNNVASLPSQPYGALVQLQASSNASTLPALVRFLNASLDNHPFHPHGNHVRVIAQDGRLLRGPANQDLSTQAFTKTIGSGQTYDLLFKWTNVDAWTPTGNAYPVTFPGQQDVVYKDNATFYSGSPYLGVQGELPVGVTQYNHCGEFYYPWHSHALYEFTNFDEGFGGLATLLRVDPPAGCSSPAPQGADDAFPSSTVIQTGTPAGGSAASLAADDASYFSVNSNTSSTKTVSWYGKFASIPNAIVSLKVTYKGKNSLTCSQTIALYNFNTASWTVIDTRNVGAETLISEVPSGGTANAFVSGSTGNGEVRVRIECKTTAGTFVSSGNLMKITVG
jgi:FtsP/CotA-like multicopper oxidase with cupredoxin domain